MPVVKQRWTVDAQPFDELSHFARSFGEFAFDIYEETAAEIEPEMLADLQFYPPVPPGSKYVRTFKLRDSWVIRIYPVSESEFVFEVSNDAGYTQWVVGSLAQSVEAAARFQRDFHKKNGWILATETVTFWFETFLDLYESRFDQALGQFGSSSVNRRATTRI